MIPKKIQDKHIKQAAGQIILEGVPARRNSVHYDVVIGGKRFPPKLIISLATKFATGKEYDPADFNAVEAKNYFQARAYDVIDRRVDQELEPKTHQLVMDLVREAGIDVSDWANFRGGENRAASNPKYCYDWAFVEQNKVVVLNLWFASMESKSGAVIQKLNPRKFANSLGNIKGSSVMASRALRMDGAIQVAWQNKLPVRVIVCEGSVRDIAEPDSKASKVKLRMLDPVPWAITSYNLKTGECVVKRGAMPNRFVDQFSTDEYEGKAGARTVSGTVRNRDGEVRRRVLIRAGGQCEYRGEVGFLTHDGRIFLETHHVVPLSENGVDSTRNVIALCPNHHREAHHGSERTYLRKAMLGKLHQLTNRKHKCD